MVRRNKYVIIGGGIIGLSTAYELLRRGPRRDVTIMEAGPVAGRGASWANGSMIHPSQATPWNEAGKAMAPEVAARSFLMAQRSSQILKDRFKAFDIEPRLLRRGTSKIYRDRAIMAADMKNLQPLFALGLRADIMDASQSYNKLGLRGAGLDIVGGVHFPDDHSGPARIYCEKLIEQIQHLGGTIKLNYKVSALSDLDRYDRIILCAGAGCAPFGAVSIKGIYGYSRTYDIPAHLLPPMAIMDDRAHMCVLPIGDHLRVAGIADVDYNVDRYAELEAFVFTLLPHLQDKLKQANYEDWSAQRPMSSSGPIIGHIQGKVWANTGHGHMGWTLSAGSAEHLVVLMNQSAEGST